MAAAAAALQLPSQNEKCGYVFIRFVVATVVFTIVIVVVASAAYQTVNRQRFFGYFAAPMDTICNFFNSPRFVVVLPFGIILIFF